MINIILFPFFFLTVSFHPSLNIRIFLRLYSVGNSSVVRIISNNERAFYFILCFFVGSTLLGHTQDAIVIALYGTAATIEQTSSYNTHNTEEKGKSFIQPMTGVGDRSQVWKQPSHHYHIGASRNVRVGPPKTHFGERLFRLSSTEPLVNLYWLPAVLAWYSWPFDCVVLIYSLGNRKQEKKKHPSTIEWEKAVIWGNKIFSLFVP